MIVTIHGRFGEMGMGELVGRLGLGLGWCVLERSSGIENGVF